MIFSSKHVKPGHKLEITYFVHLLNHAHEAPLANVKMEREAHLVESSCKEWNISDANWLRYLSSPYLIEI